MRVKIIFLGISLFVLFQSLNAADNAGAFIRNGIQPKATALGLGYTAMAEGSEGVFWNPAVLGVPVSSDITIAGSQAYETTFLSTSVLWKKTAVKMPIGLMVSYAGAGGIPETKIDSETLRLIETGESLSYMGMGLFLGTGKEVRKNVWVGVTGKVLYEHAGENSAVGGGLDLGGLVRLSEDLKMGLMCRNAIQPVMQWDTPSKSRESVPREINVGTVYKLYRDKVILTGDFVMREDRQALLRGGVEYRPYSFLPLWVGINGKDFSVGTGLDVGTLSIAFSWTKNEVDLVSDSYRFGIRTRW